MGMCCIYVYGRVVPTLFVVCPGTRCAPWCVCARRRRRGRPLPSASRKYGFSPSPCVFLSALPREALKRRAPAPAPCSHSLTNTCCYVSSCAAMQAIKTGQPTGTGTPSPSSSTSARGATLAAQGGAATHSPMPPASTRSRPTGRYARATNRSTSSWPKQSDPYVLSSHGRVFGVRSHCSKSRRNSSTHSMCYRSRGRAVAGCNNSISLWMRWHQRAGW